MTTARFDRPGARRTAARWQRTSAPSEGVRRVTDERIEQLSGMAVRLATDPVLIFGRGACELAEEAGHDRELLGRSWMRVAVATRKCPSRVGATAERLLRAALQYEVVWRAAA